MKFTLSVLVLLHLPTVSIAQGPGGVPGAAPPPPPTYYSVYVPVGAGEPQTERTEFKAFGHFPDVFTQCGKVTTPNLNEALKLANVPTDQEIYVDCEPSPTRVIVAEDVEFKDFERKFEKECELFACSDEDYEAAGTDLASITNSEGGDKTPKAPVPEKAETNVCGAKKAGYLKAGKRKVVFANEADCFNFMPDLKTKLTREGGKVVRQVPRWLKNGEDRVNLRHFYFSDEKSENLERIPYIFTSPQTPNPEYQQCNTACDEGTVVKITMNPGAYSSMIYIDEKKCSSFRICFSPTNFLDDQKTPTCLDDFTIDVLVKNGIVIWGKKGRSSIIEFRSPYHDNATAVPIEFGFGVVLKADPAKGRTTDEMSGNFYFGNDHREFVTSDSVGYDAATASQLAFIFPHTNCLKKSAGIFSKNIQTGKALTTTKLKVGHLFNEKGEAITGATFEVATTTTQEPIHDLAYTTTPAAISIIPEPGALSLIMDDQSNSDAVFIEGKWWTWGIYLGFIIGTLSTLGIGSGLFYVLRRTVFSVWYRGMYKRYGCDASGTTGGITGIGFGNTTAAIETVVGTTGGGTTMGTTTGGETTTSGGTTGNLTSSTSKTSTLAM